MNWVVAPFDQTLPLAADEIKITLPPWQNVVAPVGVIEGVAANGFTVTVVAAEAAELQVPLLNSTEYVPESETVIDCVVAPFDQVFPVADDDVRVTLPPWQNVVAPETVIVGVAGAGVIETTVAADGAEVQVPLLTETVYEPADVTVIDCVVAPFDQTFPVADDEVNVTLPPWQKVVAPDAVMVGTSPEKVALIV